MKQLTTLLFFLVTSFLMAQTNISGVINSYAAVQGLDICTGEVTVADATGFEAGDKVMIIQMKGATIVEENNAAFGTVIDLGNCGLYELSTITNVTGNVISLGFTLINDYDISGRVQLVTVPVYESATVTGDLLAQNWDGNKGGVLALEVESILTLNANINADGAGFRGGQINVVNSEDCSPLGGGQSGYFYNSDAWQGAQKGEGIAEEIFNKERAVVRKRTVVVVEMTTMLAAAAVVMQSTEAEEVTALQKVYLVAMEISQVLAESHFQ